MDDQVVFRDGVEHQGVGNASLVHCVNRLEDGLSRVTFRNFKGKVSHGGRAFGVEQVHLGCGLVDGLVDDNVQNGTEAVWT